MKKVEGKRQAQIDREISRSRIIVPMWQRKLALLEAMKKMQLEKK